MNYACICLLPVISLVINLSWVRICAFFLFKEILDYYKRLNSNIYCCFLDAQRAFDRVKHQKVFNILFERKVPLIFIRIIAFWYRKQLVCIKWGNAFSDAFFVSNGVRQGSVLSPYLFNVYIDKISVRLNSMNIGCVRNNVIINHFFYADDMCVFSPSSFGLQKLIDVCLEIGFGLDIVFNRTKCKVMVFTSRYFSRLVTPTFTIGNGVLEEVSSFTYLGHIISNDLKDDLDINRQCKSLYARGNSLIRTFSHCSFTVKKVLFTSYCTSLYTCQLWSSYKQSSMKRLCVAYHGIFKKMLNLPRYTSNSYLFVFSEILTCQELIRKNVYGFSCRVTNNENTLVKAACSGDQSFYSKLHNHWSLVLH